MECISSQPRSNKTLCRNRPSSADGGRFSQGATCAKENAEPRGRQAVSSRWQLRTKETSYSGGSAGQGTMTASPFPVGPLGPLALHYGFCPRPTTRAWPQPLRAWSPQSHYPPGSNGGSRVIITGLFSAWIQAFSGPIKIFTSPNMFQENKWSVKYSRRKGGLEVRMGERDPRIA